MKLSFACAGEAIASRLEATAVRVAEPGVRRRDGVCGRMSAEGGSGMIERWRVDERTVGGVAGWRGGVRGGKGAGRSTERNVSYCYRVYLLKLWR